MKRNGYRMNARRGSALMTVLGLVFVVSMLLATMTIVSGQRSFTARKLSDRVRALAYAEAGANEAYYIIEQDWGQRTNASAFPLTNYGIGTYDVTVTPVSNKTAVIRSVGDCRQTTVEVVLDVKNYGDGSPGSRPIDTNAFNYAILVGGTFDFAGCGNITSATGTAALHANGLLDISGDAKANLDIRSSTEIEISNNVKINGSVTSPVLDYTPSKVQISGAANRQAVPLVTIPDIDLTPYYNWALANGEVRSGFSMSGGTYTPAGGILWVNGSVQLSSSSKVNGSIIATGDIHLSGSSQVWAPATFALASRDGSIKYTSTGTTKGLIYAKTGGLEHSANGRLEGQIIVNGNIKKTGNSDVLVYSRIIPTPPGGGTPPSSGDIIGISAWQK